MIKFSLHLDYHLSPGWLKPWTDGLSSGAAVARKCDTCGRVSFVPLRVCDCGGAKGRWVTLSGDATLLNITSGSDGCFGLVRLDGADTNCVARLAGNEPGSHHGQLVRPDGDLPAIVIAPHKPERS